MSTKQKIDSTIDVNIFNAMHDSNIEEWLLKTVEVFTKKQPRIKRDNNYPAPAAINMETFEIVFNPNLVTQMTKKAVLESLLPKIKLQEIADLAFEATKIYCLGLILHELAHYQHSPRKAMLEKYMAMVSKEIPGELVRFIPNVVEDICSQTELIKKCPSKTYKKAIGYLQEHSQGGSTVTEFMDDIRSGKITKDDIRSKLYYFILRAYNPEHPMVTSKFGRPDIIDWADDTIAAFEQAEWISDTEKRCRFTFLTVVPLVWRDLKNNNVSTPAPGDGEGEPQDGSSLSSQGDGQSDGASSDLTQGKGSDNSENTSSGSCPKANESGTGAGGDKDGDEEFSQKVAKAAKDLNSAIGENKERTDIDPKEVFRPINNDLRKAAHKALVDCRESLLQEEVKDPRMAEMAEMAFKMYESCSHYLQKLYNLKNHTETRLHNGEIDESLIPEWYTEKNIDIFKQDINLVQNKNISVTFVLDRSGSMSGYRYRYSSAMITALAHAFEDAGIKTSVYVFSSKSIKIKGFETPLILEGNKSNLCERLTELGSGGCTDPSGAFDEIVETMEEAGDQDTVKLLFFMTDGDMDGGGVERTVQEDISELAEDGWTVFAIGIDFDDYELNKLGSFTKPAIVKSYDSDSIIDTLGEDIYNTIIDNIVIKS